MYASTLFGFRSILARATVLVGSLLVLAAGNAFGQVTYTQVSASWTPAVPGTVHLTWQGSAPGSSDVALTTDEMNLMTVSPTMTTTSPNFVFYSAATVVNLTGDPLARNFNVIPPAGPLQGSVNLWAPGIPGRPNSLSEPRELLFAGERGYLACNLVNGGNTDLFVTGGQFTSSGPLSGSQTLTACVAPHASALYLVPLSSASTSTPGYYDGTLSLTATANGVTFIAQDPLTIPLGHLAAFSQTIQKGTGNTILFSGMLSVDTPAGFNEVVHTSGQINFGIAANGAMQLNVQPGPCDGTVNLPPITPTLANEWGNPAPNTTPTNYKTTISGWAKWLFQGATAAVMAAIRIAGAQAAKAILAAASQALGPEIGVPVTLVLYTPTFEAWWNVFMGGTGGLSGWVINGKIYQKIFG